jgi:uncharacterized protein YxjI
MQTAVKYGFSSYTVRTKVFKLFGNTFEVFDPDGNLILYVKQKAFRLKEDIRLYSDKSQSQELLTIRARQIVDWSAAYDVEDSTSGERVGALRRKGWTSLLRDNWVIMDHLDNEIGTIVEKNAMLSVLRRVLEALVINLVPQSYSVRTGDVEVCSMKQNFNPFVTKIHVQFQEGSMLRGIGPSLDRRLALAAAVLLCAVEGKQT